MANAVELNVLRILIQHEAAACQRAFALTQPRRLSYFLPSRALGHLLGWLCIFTMAYSPISVRSHDSLDQSIPAQQPLQPCVSASEECHVPSPCSDEHHVDTLPASPPPHAPASHSSRPSSPGSVPKPVGKIRRHERRIFIWWPECLAMLGSIAFLIAIAAVLLAFHTKPLATWSMPWQIKPNTLVSILMTLCRLTMLVVVAECLSQLKWVYFQQRAHPLTHFQVFDDASRGPWGSLRLLIAVNWTAIAASFGAVITILALAMEPFTQQVLSYPVRNATERTAVLWRADAYDYGTAPQVMNVDEPFPSAPYGRLSEHPRHEPDDHR